MMLSRPNTNCDFLFLNINIDHNANKAEPAKSPR